MKKIFLFSLLLFSCLIFRANSQAQPIELTIQPDKENYEAGERIKLEITFKNNSDKTQILFWSKSIPNVIKGQDALTVQTSTSLFPQVKRIDLSSGYSNTKILSIPTSDIKDGIYQLKLEYSPANVDENLKFTPGQEVFSGSITSNTIKIKITDNRKFK